MIMIKEETGGHNSHYSTKHHKYTINLPIGLIRDAVAKSKQAGFVELAPYLRAIISKEVTSGTMSIQDILGEKEFQRKEYQIKQRREEDYKTVLKVSSKNFLDKIRKLGVYFRSNSDQQFFEF